MKVAKERLEAALAYVQRYDNCAAGSIGGIRKELWNDRIEFLKTLIRMSK
jgi:hypothetical protein